MTSHSDNFAPLTDNSLVVIIGKFLVVFGGEADKGKCNCRYCPTLTVNTSQLAPCNTLLAVEPSKRRMPARPWLPMAIRSADNWWANW